MRLGKVKQSTFVLIATLSCSIPPVLWAEVYEGNTISQEPVVDEIQKIEQALTDPLEVPPGSQDLANGFVEDILPKLLASNESLVHQLGFGDSTKMATIDQAFAVMLIRRDDILNLIEGKKQPFQLVNNANNWLVNAGRLVPKRIVFLLKGHQSANEASDGRSSVTLEQSPDGSSWRIIQVGAPKLSSAMRQAIKDYKKPNPNHFLLWIPDLNRHYLGTVENHMLNLTVLFKDRLTEGEPGKDQIVDADFLGRLKQLYEDLDLPKKQSRQLGTYKEPPKVQAP
jgi:hypothetical protein